MLSVAQRAKSKHEPVLSSAEERSRSRAAPFSNADTPTLHLGRRRAAWLIPRNVSSLVARGWAAQGAERWCRAG